MPRSNKQFSIRSFGPALRRERESAGITQKELGERVGLSQKHVSELESGAADPRLAVAVALAEALGIGPEKFGKKFLIGIG